MNRLSLFLFCGLYIITSGLYFYTEQIGFQHIFITKVLPILILFLFVDLKVTQRKNHFRLAIAFSACGDIALALTDMAYYFEIGLGAFLLAHIAYILALWPSCKFNRNTAKHLIAGLLVGLGIILIAGQNAEAPLVPMIVYALAIVLTMTLSAAQSHPALKYYWLGGWLFLISDSLIVLNKFWQTLPYSDWSIMLTYYLAQGILIFMWGNAHRNND